MVSKGIEYGGLVRLLRARILDQDDAIVCLSDLCQQRVGECRLAGRSAAGDEDVCRDATASRCASAWSPVMMPAAT
jgi:hypothetical protein